MGLSDDLKDGVGVGVIGESSDDWLSDLREPKTVAQFVKHEEKAKAGKRNLRPYVKNKGLEYHGGSPKCPLLSINIIAKFSQKCLMMAEWCTTTSCRPRPIDGLRYLTGNR